VNPRTYPELQRLSGDDCRAIVAEFMGINATPQEGCRHDWLTLEDTPILIESEWTEDHYGRGFVAICAMVNGSWVDVEDVFPNHGTEWSAEVQRIADRELQDHRAQEFA